MGCRTPGSGTTRGGGLHTTHKQQSICGTGRRCGRLKKNEDKQESDNKTTGVENDGEITGVDNDNEIIGADSDDDIKEVKAELGSMGETDK